MTVKRTLLVNIRARVGLCLIKNSKKCASSFVWLMSDFELPAYYDIRNNAPEINRIDTRVCSPIYNKHKNEHDANL